MFKNYSQLLKNQHNLNKIFDSIDFDDNIPKVNNCSKIVQKCECGSNELIEDQSHGALVCQNCGQVFGEILDYNPEWKHYDDSDIANARCGAPINALLPQASMGTSIGGMGNSRMKIIHNWHSMPYKERSLNNEFKIIANICQKINIPKCIEDDTKIMYKMASECKHQDGKNIITRGKNRISISAACMYFACEKKGMTYTPKEIAGFYNIKYADINKGIKNLRKLIETKQITPNTTNNTPNQFIKRYCNNLKMLNIHSDEAIRISNNIERLNIGTEHNPYSLAAACILFVAEVYKLKHINKKRLAAEFNISDVTIGKTYKKIDSYRDIILDNEKVEEAYKQLEVYEQTHIDDDIPAEIMEQMKLFGVIPNINSSYVADNEINIEKEYLELVEMGKKIQLKKNKLLIPTKCLCL